MFSLIELKAQAFDLIANIEFLQHKLKEINTKIAELSKKENEDGQSNSGNHI